MPTASRLRALALLSPLLGTMLFLPPYISIFDQPDVGWDVPLLLLYIFSIWAVGILLTALMSRWLVGLDGEPAAGDADAARRDDV